VSIDGSESGTVLDPRGVEPVFQRSDGAVNGSAERDADLAPHAFLVGPRPADREDHPLLSPLKVIAVDCNHLGPPEAAGKPEQQERLVPQVLEPITHRPENDKDVLTEEGLGLMLSRSEALQSLRVRGPIAVNCNYALHDASHLRERVPETHRVSRCRLIFESTWALFTCPFGRPRCFGDGQKTCRGTGAAHGVVIFTATVNPVTAV
jgi:hypothetical protein